MKCILAAALAALLSLSTAPTLAQAQKTPTERIDELERRLEQSLRMIEQLSGEVARLRGAAATEPGLLARERDAQQNVKIEGIERQVEQIFQSNEARNGLRLGGVALHGFADLGAGYSREANRFQSGAKGFSVGSFGLYLTPEFGPRLKGLAELVFEVDRGGDLLIDFERLQLGYVFGDAATLWGGRFHTPYGYWNTAFHHGQQIQTSLSRPRFLEFEDRGGILPSHSVGAWLTGALPLGGTRIGYDLYVANGPRIAIDAAAPAPGGTLNPNVGGDDNHSAQIGFRAEIAPRGALDGLKVGVFALRAGVQDDSAAVNRTRLLSYGAYAAFETNRWEILSEYYRFRNRDLSGASGTHQSSAWYAQVAHDMGDFKPYLRIERAMLDQADNYFAMQNSGRSYSTTAIGFRIDLSPSAALKFEAGRTNLRNVLLGGGNDRFGELRTQFSVRF